MENNSPVEYRQRAWESDFLCQICQDVADKPMYCVPCFQNDIFKFVCKDCYLQKGYYAKNFEGEECKTLNPKVEKINKGVKDYLNSLSYQCPNYGGESDLTYKELLEHLKKKECDGITFNISKINDVKERIENIKLQDRFYDIKAERSSDKIELRDDWDTYNAKCLVCFYLSSLDGYICYNCTRLCGKDHCEEFNKYVQLSMDANYHPFGLLACIYCKKYAMVKLDRIPQTYDQIFKFLVPECNTAHGTKKSLYYQQMYQHERVCQKLMNEALDPVNVKLIPYFHTDGTKISLLATENFKNFYNSDIKPEKTVESNIKLGKGFKVCLLRDTNHIFIVGGEGSENKTFVFNPDTNKIDETSWDLKYPRIGHSLCSTNNTIICTGSSVSEEGDDYVNCRKVEVFKPEWNEWREGQEMHYERFNHFSIGSQGRAYVMFGQNPRYDNSAQDGIEYIDVQRVSGAVIGWKVPKELERDTLKLSIHGGILPDPYSNRILIFGKKEEHKGFAWDESDDDDETDTTCNMLVFDPDNPKADVYNPLDYNQKKYTFDRQNLPMFFKGVYYVFGEDLSSVMICGRDFRFTN